MTEMTSYHRWQIVEDTMELFSVGEINLSVHTINVDTLIWPHLGVEPSNLFAVLSHWDEWHLSCAESLTSKSSIC